MATKRPPKGRNERARALVDPKSKTAKPGPPASSGGGVKSAATQPKASSSGPSRRRRPAPALWETLFDQFWLETGGSPRDAWPKLSEVQRMAVAIGLFDSQIRHNGAQLWITNGYLYESPGVREALKILGTPSAAKAVKMLSEILKIAVVAERLEGANDEAGLDALAERCCEIDERYCALSSTIMSELEAWLVARTAAPPAQVAPKNAAAGRRRAPSAS